MEVFINNSAKKIKDGSTIKDVLNDIKVDNIEGYAIAINNSVVPKADWNNYKLKDQDKLLLIKATGGG